MQTLENAKQLVHMLHVESGAIIPDEDFDLILFFLPAAYLDFCPLSRPRELNGIGKQVHKNYPEHSAVSATDRKRADLPRNVASVRIFPKLRNDSGDQLLQVDGYFDGLGTPDSREAQQVIDQISHPLGRFQYSLQVVVGFLVQCWSRAPLQQLGIADDMAKRRAQVMRHGIGERFQLLIRRLQLDSAPCQLLLSLAKIILGTAPNCAETRNGKSANHEDEKVWQLS